MKPATLVTVSTDPRKSARPAEAIRIAAGVGTWKKTDVTVLLNGEAAYALSEYPDELIDEDNFTRYLPIIAEFGRPIYVSSHFKNIDELGSSPWKYETISDEEIVKQYGRHHYFLHF